MNCLKVSAFLHGFYGTGDMVDCTCLLSGESHALCCCHLEFILPLHFLAIGSFCLKQNVIVANPLSSEECGVLFSSFSGILLQVIQIKQRCHSQPWQKRVKICSAFCIYGDSHVSAESTTALQVSRQGLR